MLFPDIIPDAAKQIVQEEDLQGITASKESAEPVLPTTTSDAMKEKAPQTWVVKKEKVLTWTSSPPHHLLLHLLQYHQSIETLQYHHHLLV